MTVIRPNSISGITSITAQGGDINVFRADGTTGDLVVNNVTTGIITATTFVGGHSGNGANLTNLPAGNLTGNLPAISAANLTNIPAANITGTVADARISTLTASKLSGALPAISAANLTNIPAANITGTLPAISGANLTGISAGGASNITFNSGNGISFAATADGTGSSNMSELLDDYETGEWTGTINSGSANINNAWYVKIGKLVIGGGSITAISDTSSSNSIIVNGLPFSNSGGATGRGAVSASKNNQFDKMVDCYVSGTTVRFMESSLSTGSWDYLRHSSMVQSSGSITFAFNYQTA